MTSDKVCTASQGNNGQVSTKERQMEALTERFLKTLQTGSHSQRLACLTEDLLALGCTAVHTDNQGNLTATLEANHPEDAPIIGLIAVMDSGGSTAQHGILSWWKTTVAATWPLDAENGCCRRWKCRCCINCTAMGC